MKRHLLYSLVGLSVLLAPAMGWSAEGFVVTVDDVTINDSLIPVATFTMMDAEGNPVGIQDVAAEGDVSVRGVILSYIGADGKYLSYNVYTVTAPEEDSPNPGATAEQVGYDSDGVWADLGNGRFSYTFGVPVPADYDMNATHTLSAQMERTVDEVRYVANPVHHFVPAGGDVVALRRVSTTESCNTCHTSIGIHGGARKEYTLCITCHTSQNADPDTGNSVEMGEMIHKIHMGANLPSVQAGEPYQIVGYRQSVHDYSEVHYPQPVNNCASCHNGPEGDVYLTEPNMVSCGACHDDIDFVAGVGHIAQADSSMCATCHPAQGTNLAILDNHIPSYRDPALAGLNAEILEVRNAAPGQAPSVVFTITNDDGTAVDLTTLSTIRLIYAGPTSDYAAYTQETANDAIAPEGDALVYNFTTPIPEDAMGSYAFSIESRRSVALSDDESINEGFVNPVVFAAVTDDNPVARRSVVNDDKCNACHDYLAFHGGQRIGVDYCVMCHNPNTDDLGRRPAEVGGGESVSFGYMIHKIHQGHNLTQPYTVYGFGNRAHDYTHILFPGINNACTICHVDQPELPVPETNLPINFTNLEGEEILIQPASANCLSCHDDQEAADHAAQFVNDGVESCAQCHGPGGFADIAETHKLGVELNVETTFGGTRIPFWMVH